MACLGHSYQDFPLEWWSLVLLFVVAVGAVIATGAADSVPIECHGGLSKERETDQSIN